VARLTPQQLAERRTGDHRILRQMVGPTFDFTAYRSVTDLQHRRHPITSDADGQHATAYLIELRIRTLIGAGKFRDATRIGIDTNVAGYPQQEPNTFLLDTPVPYSPHFRQGMPVCIGGYWADREGQVLLGHLVVHIARLLNWDEVARGGGYVGWNAEAIAYHAHHYGARPLDPDVVYPALPGSVFAVPTGSFTPVQQSGGFAPVTPAGGFKRL
jgi:hypothetical protein